MHAISMEISDLSQEDYNMCDVVYEENFHLLLNLISLEKKKQRVVSRDEEKHAGI